MKNYKVYVIKNKFDDIIYCGMTGNSLKKRLAAHKSKFMLNNTYKIELVVDYLTREEAAILERKLIEQYKLLENGLNKSPKNRIARLGQKNGAKWKKAQFKSHAKPVICLETGKIYPSARHAARDLNLQYSKISLVCNGKRKTTGGYHFEFYKKR